VTNHSVFIKRLKEARAKMKISQKNLGIAIGVEESSASSRMNHYEQGRHYPDAETIKKMAEALDMPLPFFFCESDKLAQLICLVADLNDDEQDTLINQLSQHLNDE
jgi:transcriptional regulator with XRE-family HTH domain